MRLYQYLLDAQRETPDRVALEFMNEKISYAKLADLALRIADGITKAGFQPGDSAGVMLPNIPQFVAAHYGILMAGGVFVPMNVMLQGPEIEYLCRDSDIRVIITYEMFVESVKAGIAKLENPPKVFVIGENVGGFSPFGALIGDADFTPIQSDADTHIMTLYTSGTTGMPKGAMITNGNVIANLEMADEVFPPEPDERSLCVLPAFHAFALQGIINSGIRRRATVVMHPRFDIETCIKSLKEDAITWFAGVPTMYFYILKHPQAAQFKFPTLRRCITGGAPMPVEVMTRFEEIFGVPVYEGFGMTETTVSVCLNGPQRRKIGSVGVPYSRVKMRVVDDNDQDVPDGQMGEIIVQAPNVMKGYLNRHQETADTLRDGWLHTGDIGYRDEEGFFYIVDRKKDMIIKGGFNIYPREIEEVIFQLPQVAEAAVVGIADDALGEQVAAVVAFKPGQSLTVEQIDEHLRAHLAKYKLPQHYLIVPELPKGPTGKILKRELRKNWQEQVPAG